MGSHYTDNTFIQNSEFSIYIEMSNACQEKKSQKWSHESKFKTKYNNTIPATSTILFKGYLLDRNNTKLNIVREQKIIITQIY